MDSQTNKMVILKTECGGAYLY